MYIEGDLSHAVMFGYFLEFSFLEEMKSGMCSSSPCLPSGVGFSFIYSL